MRRLKLTALSPLVLVALVAGCSPDSPTSTAPASASDSPMSSASSGAGLSGYQLSPAPEGVVGVFWSRDEAALRELVGTASASGQARTTANMTYHGGKIMPTATTKAFFRGTSWGTYSGDKMTGMDAFYTGYSNSNYQKTVIEYTGSNGIAGSSPTVHQGHYVSTLAETSNGGSAAVLSEICSMITASGTVIDASGNGYYALYSDKPRGSAGYCAWHSAGSCGGKAIQFAFFWNLDGDAGCNPSDASGLHSQGLSAIANVGAHELAEAMSDPASPGAWYDSAGQENADKCAWTFGGPLATFSNGTQWKVQGEWSNKAYTAGTGYANRSGQKGCIGGL